MYLLLITVPIPVLLKVMWESLKITFIKIKLLQLKNNSVQHTALKKEVQLNSSRKNYISMRLYY